MNIIKRDGSQAVFDSCKIASAACCIHVAFDETNRLVQFKLHRFSA